MPGLGAQCLGIVVVGPGHAPHPVLAAKGHHLDRRARHRQADGHLRTHLHETHQGAEFAVQQGFVAVAAVMADRVAEQAGADAQPWPVARWRGRFEAHLSQ